MDPNQLKLFRQITFDYFAKLSPDDAPQLEEPYLRFGEPATLDYTSLVEIRGQYDGCIYLTSPVPMLEQLLNLHGEPAQNETTLKDMCRELSNVLAGNASQAFGGHWEISVPISLSGDDLEKLPLPDSAFVMPLLWRQSRALLVIALADHGTLRL